MISDNINDYTLFIPTLSVPSTYHKRYDATTSMLKYTLSKAPLLITKLISKEKDKPCYKTSINNISIFVENNDIYKNSQKKSLIMENINSLICEYGQSEVESIQNIKEKIEYNVEMYNTIKKNNKKIDKMSQIFFDTIKKIHNELS